VKGREDREDSEDMASWVGQPAVKGSTESMRMILLTFSLIGLQCVPQIYYCLSVLADEEFRFTWGIEMTCEMAANGTIFLSINLIPFYRLHSLFARTGPHEESNISRMDCGSIVRTHNAANCRRSF
jgi:hypothetical protein